VNRGGEAMDVQECIRFATENPVCFFATADGDQPHVRTLLMCSADEQGFNFGILSPKAVFKQLQRNDKVEVCFFHNSTNRAEWKMMRVTGRTEVVNDPELKKRVCQERHALEEIIGRPLEPIVEIVRVKGEACFWTLRDALRESELERVRF
jgi:pyridoxamine 5'-phosphate oxidase